MERLGESGTGFRSLTEAIDTTTSAGRMMMQMVGAYSNDADQTIRSDADQFGGKQRKAFSVLGLFDFSIFGVVGARRATNHPPKSSGPTFRLGALFRRSSCLAL